MGRWDILHGPGATVVPDLLMVAAILFLGSPLFLKQGEFLLFHQVLKACLLPNSLRGIFVSAENIDSLHYRRVLSSELPKMFWFSKSFVASFSNIRHGSYCYAIALPSISPNR
uniref:Uncharacterized protein n=1 Tax=Sphaerodactylus townsendi TaxID=933632 RepID=A0ACB8FRC3_9SAUR